MTVRRETPRLGDLTPAEYQRVCDLVARATGLDAGARASLLDEACAGEPPCWLHRRSAPRLTRTAFRGSYPRAWARPGGE